MFSMMQAITRRYERTKEEVLQVVSQRQRRALRHLTILMLMMLMHCEKIVH